MPVDDAGSERYSRHGQLVGDWVSLFAPVVFEPHRRWSWPADGSIVLDHLGFRISELRPDGTPKTGPVAFNVLAAQGYENGSPFLWKLAASPTVTKDDWVEFLDGLDGVPQRVVSDGHDGTIKAAMALWPEAAHWRSEWHLRAAFYDELVACKQHGDTRLHRALKQAFVNRYFWPRPHQPADHRRPGCSAGAQRWATTVKLSHGLLNRARLDCLLMLMQLHLNGQPTEAAYTRAIRDWLTVNGGRPNRARRWAAEPHGTASLRSPRARR